MSGTCSTSFKVRYLLVVIFFSTIPWYFLLPSSLQKSLQKGSCWFEPQQDSQQFCLVSVFDKIQTNWIFKTSQVQKININIYFQKLLYKIEGQANFCFPLQNWGLVWLCCLNNTTQHNTTHIFTTLFHPYIFSQHLNNVTKTTIPNKPRIVETEHAQYKQTQNIFCNKQ